MKRPYVSRGWAWTAPNEITVQRSTIRPDSSFADGRGQYLVHFAMPRHHHRYHADCELSLR